MVVRKRYVCQPLFLGVRMQLLDVGLGVGLSCSSEANSVELKFGVVDIAMELDSAVPCALIFNELISNAFKHGLPAGRQGAVRIGLNHGEGDELVLGDEEMESVCPPILISESRSR